jgi:Tfp pilus assembly protein PilF
MELSRATYTRCPAQRRPFPTTVALVLILAGCADARQPELSHRQPSLRVADAALASGAPGVALRVADLTLAREPRNLRALIARGDALYAMGEREMARAAYRTAVAADPTAAAAQLGLGRTLVQLDPGAAEAAFLSVIAKEPNNIAALSNLGIARDLQGHHADAQDAYRQALVVAPEAADVKVNLGLSLALSGSNDKAVRVLQEAATDPSAIQDRRKELAGAFTLAGDEADARRTLSGAFAQQEPNSRPGYSLAGDAPVSASHQALANGNLLAPALDLPPMPIVANGKPSDGDMLPHETRIMNTFAPTPAVARMQPDMLHVLIAPVVAVARTSQWAPPDRARPAAPGAPDSSQVRIPSSQGPNVSTTSDNASPAPTGKQVASSTPAVSTGTGAPSQLALGVDLAERKQSGMPEGAAFAQLASFHSAQTAWYEWQRLNKRMPGLLSGQGPVITRSDVLGQTFWRLRTFGFASLAEARAMCSRILDAGQRCWARAAS